MACFCQGKQDYWARHYFKYFTANEIRTETETIDQLKKEIEQLIKDIYQYKYQLDQLSSRVANLGSYKETSVGANIPATKSGFSILASNWNAENFIGKSIVRSSCIAVAFSNCLFIC